MNEKIELKRCGCCEKLLPIESFDKHGKSKYKKVCRDCKAKAKGDNSLKSATIQTLLRELRERGVKGKFTYTRTETIEI